MRACGIRSASRRPCAIGTRSPRRCITMVGAEIAPRAGRTSIFNSAFIRPRAIPRGTSLVVDHQPTEPPPPARTCEPAPRLSNRGPDETSSPRTTRASQARCPTPGSRCSRHRRVARSECQEQPSRHQPTPGPNAQDRRFGRQAISSLSGGAAASASAGSAGRSWWRPVRRRSASRGLRWRSASGRWSGARAERGADRLQSRAPALARQPNVRDDYDLGGRLERQCRAIGQSGDRLGLPA